MLFGPWRTGLALPGTTCRVGGLSEYATLMVLRIDLCLVHEGYHLLQLERREDRRDRAPDALPLLALEAEHLLLPDFVVGRSASSHVISHVGFVDEVVKITHWNEAKSVAGNHWLQLSPSVALLRGQVWSSLGIRCQQQQLVD